MRRPTFCQMSEQRLEILMMTAFDPVTGEEGATGYGVMCSSQHGTAVVRAGDTLEELARQAGGDLNDEEALWDWVAMYDPSIGTYSGWPIGTSGFG